MISFKSGEPKAIVQGGKYNNKILYICDPNKKCCEACGPQCIEEEDKCCEECSGGCCMESKLNNNRIDNNVLDMVDEDYIRSLKKKMTSKDMYALNRSFRSGELENDFDHLEEVFTKVVKQNSDLSKREFKIWDNGTVQPLVDFKKTFRYYVCGPTDSGKSYYVGQLLKQLRKVYPDKRIYIFSDVDEDPELDSIGNLSRLKLDEGLLKKKPIEPKALADSVCVFDDIDSIQNTKLLAAIEKLRDSLLRRGRHEQISTIVTSHLCSNYKSTRTIMNECNAITFFPKSGATDAIKYTLKKYVGMSKKDIDKVFELPSRYVTVFKNNPQFVIYEKGMYLL